MTTMIRQGDILLRAVDPPFREPTGEPVERLVLAEGEATGHAHVIEGSILATTAGGRTLLRVFEGRIHHPDHDPVPRPIPAGYYEVIRQRVYSPNAPRPVRD